MTVHISVRPIVLLAVVAALALGVLPARAQSNSRESADQIARRLLDKEAIEYVLLEYGRALDARDFKAYSSLFASDGEWIGGFGSVKGPANIKAFMEKNMGTNGNPTHNYHLLSNFVISV